MSMKNLIRMARMSYILGGWWVKVVMILAIALILLSLTHTPVCPSVDDIKEQLLSQGKLSDLTQDDVDDDDDKFIKARWDPKIGAVILPNNEDGRDGNNDPDDDVEHVIRVIEKTSLPAKVPEKEKLQGPAGLQNVAEDDKRKPKPPAAKETPTLSLFEVERLPVGDVLNQKLITNSVYYVWCGRRWFEFQHYLSIMSVARELRPDNIIFHYDFLPVMDSWIYNTWFQELQEEFPFFHLQPLSADQKACDGFSRPNMPFIRELLSTRGGVYVSEYTIIARLPQLYRAYDLVHALNENSMQGYVMARRGIPREDTLMSIVRDKAYTTKTLRCSTIQVFNSTSTKKPTCVNTEGRFFPRDFWEATSTDRFSRLVRKIFYQNPEVPKVQHSYDELVPNIAHIVWLGGGDMDFLFYLCVLSLIYVAEVDMVYIHGDAPPGGPYWQSLLHETKLQHIYRESPNTVFGNEINVLSHVTDVWRVDFMLKYGGIYVDTDTVFIRPLDREIRSYDAVATFDWTYWNPPFPDTINFGVTIGKKGAEYWKHFQKSMKWFIDKDWSWNGLRQPYRIKERHPELMLVDPRMQVCCFEFKCHPTWWKDYHNESLHHLNSNNTLDWKKDIYAFHWTLPTPEELKSQEKLLASKTIFAEIGRYILQKAGRLSIGTY